MSPDGDSPGGHRGGVPGLLEGATERFADRPAQRYAGGHHERSLSGWAFPAAPNGEYASFTYEGLRGLVAALAAGFRAVGIEPGDRAVLYAAPRVEWVQTDLALQAAGAVVVPVHHRTGPDRLRELLASADAATAVVDGEERLETLREAAGPAPSGAVALEPPDAAGDGGQALHPPATGHEERPTADAGADPASERPAAPGVETVVVADAVTAPVAGAEVHTLGDLYVRGHDHADPDEYASWLEDRAPGDPAVLAPTGGATGPPGSVRLTHGTLVAAVESLSDRLGPASGHPRAVEADSLVYTHRSPTRPLARTLGTYLPLSTGGCTAHPGDADDLRAVAGDLRAVRPTTLVTVPRVVQLAYQRARRSVVDGGRDAEFFSWAADVARTRSRDGGGLATAVRHRTADRLVYRTVREAFGGRLELLVSGGAPFPRPLAETLDGMGLRVHDAYALAAGVVAVDSLDDPTPGTVGPPLPGVEARIDGRVLPDREYDDSLGDIGELLVDGPAVASDGWLRTGDVLQRRPDGRLLYRERVDDAVALSTGWVVAPGRVERAVEADPAVEGCFAFGAGRPCVATLVVPALETLRSAASSAGEYVPGDAAAACETPWVRDRVGGALASANDRLAHHETVHRFRLVPSVPAAASEAGTAAAARSAVAEHYGDTLAAAYEGVTAVDDVA
jgi:long-chain acyl-CoA synthetase